ncbi:MAG: DUF1887 family protein [Prosthecobacter sp.]|uniref:Card1-like endonuclease domain-containing protein n=1 Tax=Prosthecobacter sp. TaxID=1965333 RepID=UPI0025EBF34F|nr:DUF1887 family CARF protein [Prosthecobacter sp.]MCF7786756.1 DUF1887 family protein [Prosthecobacter sp.]
MQPTTLIQLISEQTIQNLLPILRLKPQKLVHLVTPRTAARSAVLKAAAKAAGIDPESESIQLSDMPGIPECFNVVTEALSKSKEGMQTVVNFTGGTKLMSIGAFAAAQTKKVPSLYVDTQDACFVDGATSPEMSTLLSGDWSFTPIRNQLRVDVLGIANGVSRITSGESWQVMLPLAEHLFNHISDEEATHAAVHGPTGLFPKGLEPRTPKDWLPILDKPIRLPAPVAMLAVEADLVRPGPSDSEVLLPNSTRAELDHLVNHQVPDFAARYFKAVAPIQQAAAFLTGAWWEVIVSDAAQKSSLFRDLRWSAQVGERNGPDTEEDILGVDGVELLYINCKRGGAKARLLPLLEEVRARAATMGGSFNRRFLAVLQPPHGKVAANLQQQAAKLGIRLITGDNVYQSGIFSR